MGRIFKNSYIKVAMVLVCIISLFVVYLIKNGVVFRDSTTIDYTSDNKQNTTQIVGEITKKSTISQEIKVYNENIESIDLQFVSFSNRQNRGNVNIKVYSESIIVANKNYDVSKIKDWEFVKVPLNKKNNVNVKLIIEVSSSDCQEGSAVSLVMSQNDGMLSEGGKLIINNIQTKKILNLKVNYKSPKLNFLVFVIIMCLIWVMAPLGIYEKIYNKYSGDESLKKSVKKYCFYIILITLAFILISLRDLNFLVHPVIYAEDGSYITNIFHNGLIKSIFTTRSGQGGDFQNSGSYLLLFTALKLTKLFHGYDLSYLPTYIGIVSNLFLGIVALFTYIAFKPIGKKTSLIAYLCVILVPMGRFGAEVFGRTLNTVFIWPVFASMILIILYRQNSKKYFINIVISLLCLLSCLSFPITYGVVAIYLCCTFLRMIANKDKKVQWIINNSILIISTIIGIYLIPSLISSKGITENMVMKYSSIIEFVFARHILYPFVHFFYKYMNDGITIILFLTYSLIILLALYLENRKCFSINSYVMLLGYTVVYWLGSVVMRIKMTSLFDKYQSSFPDRYFYGCNILSVLLIVYAINIIFKELKFNKRVMYRIQTFIVAIMLINPYLFELSKSDIRLIGGYYNGNFNECVAKSLKNSDFDVNTGMFKINIYPKGWTMEIPYIYAIDTAQSVLK